MKTSNIKAREFVQKCEPFKGSNTFGESFGVNGYAVYSYGYHWPLFVKLGSQWYENTERYSMSTSKHRSQLHPHIDMLPSNTQMLKTLIAQNSQRLFLTSDRLDGIMQMQRMGYIGHVTEDSQTSYISHKYRSDSSICSMIIRGYGIGQDRCYKMQYSYPIP